MTRLPQFPPSISIEVSSNTHPMEVLEIAIDEAIRSLAFDYFKLDCIIAGTMDYGTTLISYDVIRLDKLDVNKLIYK
jgi:hypothetical protein